jgi:hypothetical protein
MSTPGTRTGPGDQRASSQPQLRQITLAFAKLHRRCSCRGDETGSTLRPMCSCRTMRAIRSDASDR